MISGLNHITVAVSDLATSLAFYCDLLGFKGHVKWRNGAYLTAGELWFCLSVDKPVPSADYTHVALSVSQSSLTKYRQLVVQHNVQQWKVNSSEGDSLYILDPDGNKLELHVGDLATRLSSLRDKPYENLVWL